jgi:cytochrome oxidase assembly protein ShyY1
VLRTALKPRWLALLAVVLAAAAVMARLGEWQLDRARQKGERERQAAAAAQPPVPVEQLLPVGTAFPVSAVDRRVTARGRWDARSQLLVPGRRLGDATGLWVLTPFRLADGSAVAVVRGWVPDAGSAPSGPTALPTGDVELAGVLRPSEPVDDLRPGAVADAPRGQVPVVAAALLAQVWPYPLADGYVVQTSASPAAADNLRRVPTEIAGGLAFQNLSYALQWWLFSAFGLFFWWRLVRDDHRGTLRPGAPAAGAGPPVGDDETVPTPDATADAGERP